MHEDGIVIFESEHPSPCSERALVLQARGIASFTEVEAGRFRLVVPEHQVDDARAEIAAYREENRNWKPRTPVTKYTYQNPWPGNIGYVMTMLIIGWAAGEQIWGLEWFELGAMHAASVHDGEWWRTLTALTLHADVAHLAGNLVFGIVFGMFVGQYLGAGVAWLCILVSGALGNWLNSLLQSASHLSVGASTAIFGALGIVAAISWKRKMYRQDRWASRLGPIIGGVALLAYTGTGGERTDIGAHLTGFASGVLIGAVVAIWAHIVSKSLRLQWLCGVGALASVAFAWSMALNLAG